MNEQHIDALPPVQTPPANDQPSTAGVPVARITGVKPTGQNSSGPFSNPPSIPGPSGIQSITPSIADDIDLIEKEWVEKAKQIVEQTKEDPYKQNEVITQVKADYIKKRYNRELKTGETKE